MTDPPPHERPGDAAQRPYYITTAIDYVNGAPHLGHAYEKITTDENYTIRAWMSVLSYLMYDYRFFYQ